MESILDRGSELSFAHENEQAETFITAEDLSAAARILVDIVEKDSKNFRAFNNMGIIAWMQKAWDDAYAMFSTSVSLKPDYLDALMNLFDSALKLHKVGECVPLFERAAALLPQSKELEEIVASIHTHKEAIYQTQRALTIGAYNKDIAEAATILAEGRLLSAMEKYLSIHDTQGPHAEVYSGLGIISYYQGKFSDAYALFVESVKLNPCNLETFLNLADAAKECGKIDDARAVYQTYAQEIRELSSIASEFERATNMP